MRLTIVCVVLLGLVSLRPAHADGFFTIVRDLFYAASWLDGNALDRLCDADTGSEANCYGVIIGIVETALLFTNQNRFPRSFCLPAGVNSDQVVDVVSKYLEQFPEQRHLSAAHLTIQALGIAFPCPQTTE